MIKEIRIPAGGQTTDAVTIGKWLVKSGDKVKRGDSLLEIETDKATLPVESFATGIVLAELFREGDTATAGDVIAYIGEESDKAEVEQRINDILKAGKEPAAEDDNQKDESSKSNTTEKQHAVDEIPAAEVRRDEYQPIDLSIPRVYTGNVNNTAGSTGDVKAMPNAKKLAKEKGIFLYDVAKTSGKKVITKKDVEAFAERSGSISSGTDRHEIKLPDYAVRYPANGIKICARVYGDGEPLVLLMGLGANGGEWKPNRTAYEKKYKCICIDNRGTGYSDAPAESAYSIAEMALDTIETLNAMGIKKAHFEGFSMGGAIAQEIAIRWPEYVKSLILVSTFPHADTKFKTALELLRDSAGVLPGSGFGKLFRYMIYSENFQNEHQDQIREAAENTAKDPAAFIPYAYKAQCNACIAYHSDNYLNRIKAPVFIAAGGEDSLISLKLTEILHKGIDGSELYIDQTGGHVHLWENPEAFNQATMNFLAHHS